eukprot:Sspe_Gene.38830::Locus_18726_Transcript_1_1_Confidence_1.000_Length_6213::g.38830::m.38830
MSGGESLHEASGQVEGCEGDGGDAAEVPFDGLADWSPAPVSAVRKALLEGHAVHYTLPSLKRAHTLAVLGFLPRATDFNVLQLSCGTGGCGFPAAHPLRRFCIRVVDNVMFDRVVLALIAINTVCLALGDPRLKHLEGVQTFLQVMEWIFLVLFTVEACLKIVARGFVAHSGAYLRISWNVLDCVVLLCSILQRATQTIDETKRLTVLRALRVLKPLRSISRIKRMQVILTTLFESLPAMVNTFILLWFVLWVFALTGMQLFGNSHHFRCAYPPGTNVSAQMTMGDDQDSCMAAGVPRHFVAENNTLLHAWPLCNETEPCGSRECETPFPAHCTELPTGAPGRFTFDNTFEALLLTLKVASLDDWPNDMEAMQKRHGHHAWVYFCLLAVVGNFFMFNLFLAVLSSTFSTVTDRLGEKAVPPLPGTITPGGVLGGSAVVSLQAVAFSLMASTLPHEGKAGQTLVELVALFASSQIERERDVSAMQGSSTAKAVARCSLLPPTDGPTKGRAADDPHGQHDDPLRQILLEAASLPLPPAPQDDPPPTGLRRVVESTVFASVVILVTVFNIAALCVDSYPESPSRTHFTDVSNLVCSWFFLLEAVLKITAYRLRYFQDPYNIFDFILVLVSVPGVLQGLGAYSAKTTKGSNALRTLRVMRVSRALAMVRVTQLRKLRRVLDTIVESVKSVCWLSGLILLLIFIYGVLGMHIFPDPFVLEGVPARAKFSTLPEACLVVFVMLTGEGWATLMKLAIDSHSPAASLYFLSLFFLGNCILLNLFLAVLVDEYASCSQRLEMDEDVESVYTAGYTPSLLEDEAPHRKAKEVTVVYDGRSTRVQVHDGVSDLVYLVGVAFELGMSGKVELRDTDGVARLLCYSDVEEGMVCTAHVAEGSKTVPREEEEGNRPRIPDCVLPTLSPPDTEDLQWKELRGGTWRVWCGQLSTCACSGREEKIPLSGQALGVLPPTHPVREALSNVVQHPWFKQLVTVLIAGNALMVSMDTPDVREHMPEVSNYLLAIDIVWAVLFLVESLLKVIAFGFYCESPHAYLRDKWNAMDFTVAWLTLIALFVPTLRPFRSLRTLRLLARLTGVRTLLACLLTVLPAVRDTVLLLVTFSFVWAVLGLQLFKGLGWPCNDHNTTAVEVHGCNGSYPANSLGAFGPEVELAARQRVPLSWSFDNLGASMWVLLEMAVGDGWASIMYDVIDAKGPGEVPQVNYAPYRALYFVVFMIVANLLLVNMFVGVLIDALVALKGQHGEALSEEQAGWVAAQEFLLVDNRPAAVLPTPGNPLVRLCQRLSTGDLTTFSAAITPAWVFRCFPLKGRRVFPWWDGQGPSPCTFLNLPVEMKKGSCVICSHADGAPPGTALELRLTAPATAYLVVEKGDGQYQRDLHLHGWEALPCSRPVVLVDSFCETVGEPWSVFVMTHPSAGRFPLPTPQTPVRLCAVVIEERSKWNTVDLVVFAVILVNAIVISLQHYRQSARLDRFLWGANIAFTCVYCIEAVVKIVGLSPRGYFSEVWNRFDFLVVAVSLLGAVVTDVSGFTFVRLFRVARLLRLLKRTKGLYTLFVTMIKSLPALWNVTLLLAVIFFMFGAIGVDLFGTLHNQPPAPGSPQLTPYLNFRNVYYALVTLFTISTTEGWVDVLQATTTSPPGCGEACGVSLAVSRVYFSLFMLFGALLVVNLFVAAVVDSYHEVTRFMAHHDHLVSAFDRFNEEWVRCDPDASGQARASDVVHVLRRTGEPLLPTFDNEAWAFQNSGGHLGLSPFQVLLRKVGDWGRAVAVTRGEQTVGYSDLVPCLSLRLFDLTLADGLRAIDGKPSTFDITVGHYSLIHFIAAAKIQQWHRRGRSVAPKASGADLLRLRETLLSRAVLPTLDTQPHLRRGVVYLLNMQCQRLHRSGERGHVSSDNKDVASASTSTFETVDDHNAPSQSAEQSEGGWTSCSESPPSPKHLVVVPKQLGNATHRRASATPFSPPTERPRAATPPAPVVAAPSCDWKSATPPRHPGPSGGVVGTSSPAASSTPPHPAPSTPPYHTLTSSPVYGAPPYPVPSTPPYH